MESRCGKDSKQRQSQGIRLLILSWCWCVCVSVCGKFGTVIVRNTLLTVWVCVCMLMLRLTLWWIQWENSSQLAQQSVILCCSYSMSLFSTESFVFQEWKPHFKLLTGVRYFTIHILQVSSTSTNILTLSECRNNGLQNEKWQKVQAVIEFKTKAVLIWIISVLSSVKPYLCLHIIICSILAGTLWRVSVWVCLSGGSYLSGPFNMIHITAPKTVERSS